MRWRPEITLAAMAEFWLPDRQDSSPPDDTTGETDEGAT